MHILSFCNSEELEELGEHELASIKRELELKRELERGGSPSAPPPGPIE
jgi:hypothetical protein